MKVYQAINAVSAQLARDGIGKTRKNDQQGYKFRGIDEVMNALAPLLANHRVIIFPRMISRQCEARTTAKGGVLYSVTVEAEFDFVSAEDGSKHTARTFGEAMDSGDKATNKAMAAAYKYAAFQTFCIPLEGSGDVDADASTPEPTGYDIPGASKADATSSRAVGASAAPGPTTSRKVYAPLPDPRTAALEKRAAKMTPEESETTLNLLRVALDACKSLDDLRDFSTKNRDTIDMLTDEHVRTLRYEAQQMRGTLKAQAAA
jgi:hypothetical protein